jgi:tRNA(Ile)-lysidine synthase
MLIDKVREKIVRESLIPRGGHVVVGFSGGPDSTCLFDVLAELRGGLGYTLSAVHVNHNLRGAEADSDQLYVEKLCGDRGVPLLVRSYDVALIAARQGKSVEEAGRDARYEAFAEAVRDAEALRGVPPSMARVALAHTKGDLSETVLMRIIRGTGPDGLSGISSDRRAEGGYRIVRPLIDVSRDEIEGYCSLRGLNPRSDSTNEKTDYLRNSVRLELLPMLREKYNPSVDDALARLSRAAAESRDYFEFVVGEAIEGNCSFTPVDDAASCEAVAEKRSPTSVDDSIEGKCSFTEDVSGGAARADFPLDLLARYHPAIRHRIIAGVFGRIGLAQDVGAVHIAAADELVRTGRTGKSVDFPGGYRFGVSYERAVFTAPRRADAVTAAAAAAVDATASAAVDAGAAASASSAVDATDSASAADAGGSFSVLIADIARAGRKVLLFEDSGFPLEAAVLDYDGRAAGGASLTLDYEALSSAAATLRLRTKAGGDRIRLPGMEGSKKLQDIFVDEKIPRERRSRIPVVAADEEVLWIPGLRRTRLYEPSPETKRVLVLTPV